MGTLGPYLRNAREALGIDLREAAQQTRISIQYLRALEEEDFRRLPGDVFVKGFLKNYGRFLQLDETEVLKKYSESTTKTTAPGNAAPTIAPAPVADEQQVRSAKLPVEPFVWGTVIVIGLVLFLFASLPERREQVPKQSALVPPAAAPEVVSAPALTVVMPVKLYLEVVALENTWLLIRTDSSPQKKAVLNKGESLIWSADEHFLLSFGNSGALKLLLNGNELTIEEPKNTVVRDLTITAAGIESRKIQHDQGRAQRSKRTITTVTSTVTQTVASKPLREQQHQSEQTPAPAPYVASPAAAPQPAQPPPSDGPPGSDH
jgi:transcriptional regulator with XRE-family HTH domain